MAWKKTDDTYYGEIASAIRAKNGTNNTYQPSQMANAIKYSIPPVNLEEKDVLFYDYEGILWYSYSFAEILALTELPPLPVKKGMIAQEWNWNLQEIQNRASDGRMTLVGAIYTTDDGSTRLYFQVAKKTRLENLQIWVNMDGNQTSTVDWGDGTTSTISNTSSSRTAICAEKNDYSIVNQDTEVVVSIKDGRFLFGDYNKGNIQSKTNRALLLKIEFGDNCYGAKSSIGGASLLNSFSFSKSFIQYGYYDLFASNYHLNAIIFPRNFIFLQPSLNRNKELYNSVVVYSQNMTQLFRNGSASRVEILVLPDGISGNSEIDLGYKGLNSSSLRHVELPFSQNLKVGEIAFADCYCLRSIKIPKNVTSIGAEAFRNCPLALIDLTDYDDTQSIPVLVNVSAFKNTPSNMILSVKNQSMYDAFTSATNWADFANNFQIDS